jgi:hypothetical protein
MGYGAIGTYWFGGLEEIRFDGFFILQRGTL